MADIIPASVNSLEQEFDDDAEEELDLRWDKDEREVIACEVEPSLLADVETISRTGTSKVTKKDTWKYSKFKHFFFKDNLLHNSQLLIIR